MAEKKKIFNISIPILRQEVALSAFEQESLKNKTLRLDLTRILHGKNLEAVFKINEKLEAEPVKLFLLQSFIRRMMRKSTSYVEDSFSCAGKESKFRIKPYLITRKIVSRAVRKALRENCRSGIIEFCKDKSNSEIFEEVLAGKMQKSLSLKLKKTYPLAFCDIRVIELIKSL